MIIYTDGGCMDNGYSNAYGSWAFVAVELKTIYCQKVINTTNNRTEMIAIINALELAKREFKGDVINVTTDSNYCYKGWIYWLDGWIKNGWKTSNKKLVSNKDLWEKIHALGYHQPFILHHCRGHGKDKNATNAYWNDIVDQACTMAMNFNDSNIHILDIELNEIEVKEDGWNGIYSSTGSKPSATRTVEESS